MSDRLAVKSYVTLLGLVAGTMSVLVVAFVLLGRRAARAEEVPGSVQREIVKAETGSTGAGDTAAKAAAPVGDLGAGVALGDRFGRELQPFLKSRCYQCHGNGKHKGDLSFDSVTSLASVMADRKTWDSVREKLVEHEMPPKKAQQPSADELASALKFIEDAFDAADAARPADPGFVAIHRLNRNEYNNTIRDLVGVDFKPADDFPADDTGYGFDNIADVLSMSPLLAEKYLNAAEQVMDKAIVTENPFKERHADYVAERMSGGEPTGNGHRILASNGAIRQNHTFPVKAEYEFHIEAEQDPGGEEPAKMRVSIGEKEIRTFEVKNRRGRPKKFDFKAEVEAGEKPVVMEFTNDFYDPNYKDPKKRDRNLIIDGLEVDGPLNVPPPPPSDVQKRLLFCGPADGTAGEICARNIFKSFAGRAFRRPAGDAEVEGLVKLYRDSRSEGKSFEESCRLAMTAVLVSPRFLYRIERDPLDHPERPHPIDDYELATRLSYFLWSSMPDEPLFELAASGKLHDPATLDGQVRRMLDDRRSSAFVTNFAGQWLELRNLALASPDPQKFPDFPRLRDDMRREGELFFRNLLDADASILDLLDAKYTFVNERLAGFYGIPDVHGDEFRKVELTGDVAAQRGGVMSMAAVLTVSALPNRTSPVKRGKFILDQILGTPPPPPPPNVPPLNDKGSEVAGLSVRKRLEAHREDPACASCHARMDPLGFALENYDAIGRWRDHDGSAAVDPSGELPDGESFTGPAGLRQLLANHRQQFRRCFVQKMLTYALGRGIDYDDEKTVKAICHDVEQNQDHFSAVIRGIVHSDAFLKRRAKV